VNNEVASGYQVHNASVSPRIGDGIRVWRYPGEHNLA